MHSVPAFNIGANGPPASTERRRFHDSYAGQQRALVLTHRVRFLVCLGLLKEAADASNELSARGTGYVHQRMAGLALHRQGLIARADSADAAALKLMLSSVAQTPVSPERIQPVLDAAWLYLEAGEPENAQQLMSSCGGYMQAALGSEHAPTMMVQARLLCESDDHAGAVALQQRHCEMMQCPEVFDIVPAMGSVRSSLY